MQNSTLESYCEDLVRSLAPDAYLAALFIPKEKRAELLTLYALDAELRHVHAAVSEEITAHIRYAWWQESLDQIAEGQTPRAHPVVEALASCLSVGVFSNEQLAALVHQYRISYPSLPDVSEKLMQIASEWIKSHSPESETSWKKASDVIHRHGKKHRWLLLLKLYWLGRF